MARDCPKKPVGPIKAIEDRPPAFFGQIVAGVFDDGFAKPKRAAPRRPAPQGTSVGEIIGAAFRNKYGVPGCATESVSGKLPKRLPMREDEPLLCSVYNDLKLVSRLCRRLTVMSVARQVQV